MEATTLPSWAVGKPCSLVLSPWPDTAWTHDLSRAGQLPHLSAHMLGQLQGHNPAWAVKAGLGFG